MRYMVKEIFRSIQGEGFLSGLVMTFVRFAGCNIWTGREEDRERCSEKGNCALWCDTDFNGGKRFDLDELMFEIESLSHRESWVCLTGGEPLLQADKALFRALVHAEYKVQVETNGTVSFDRYGSGVSWLTWSPKPPSTRAEFAADEVKVVFPAVDPSQYLWGGFHRTLQPQHSDDPEVMAENTRRTVKYVLEHPEWRLGLQTHKIVGVP